MEENTSYVIHVNERANSYEFGRASNRHKVYYKDIEDLKKQLEGLNSAGLLDDDIA